MAQLSWLAVRSLGGVRMSLPDAGNASSRTVIVPAALTGISSYPAGRHRTNRLLSVNSYESTMQRPRISSLPAYGR